MGDGNAKGKKGKGVGKDREAVPWKPRQTEKKREWQETEQESEMWKEEVESEGQRKAEKVKQQKRMEEGRHPRCLEHGVPSSLPVQQRVASGGVRARRKARAGAREAEGKGVG